MPPALHSLGYSVAACRANARGNRTPPLSIALLPVPNETSDVAFQLSMILTVGHQASLPD